jgi:uncharacterized repeat protein (TIGR03943 family)
MLNSTPNKLTYFLSLLDILAITLWGVLFLKYWFQGELSLLIHPNYFILVLITGVIFLILSCLKTWQLVLKIKDKKLSSNSTELEHINLLPKGWSSSLLILVAILGLLIKPTVLSSQTVMQRGISDSLPLTRELPEAFRTATKPEERSLIEWIRTLNAYPEPDAYNGQKANITGFVVHLPQLSDNYIYLSRFVLTCCAVDAYPVGIPVKLPQSRSNYPIDSWLEVQGEMITEVLPNLNTNEANTITEKRQLVLKGISVKPIPTPKNPYEYNS